MVKVVHQWMTLIKLLSSSPTPICFVFLTSPWILSFYLTSLVDYCHHHSEKTVERKKKGFFTGSSCSLSCFVYLCNWVSTRANTCKKKEETRKRGWFRLTPTPSLSFSCPCYIILTYPSLSLLPCLPLSLHTLSCSFLSCNTHTPCIHPAIESLYTHTPRPPLIVRNRSKIPPHSNIQKQGITSAFSHTRLADQLKTTTCTLACSTACLVHKKVLEASLWMVPFLLWHIKHRTFLCMNTWYLFKLCATRALKREWGEGLFLAQQGNDRFKGRAWVMEIVEEGLCWQQHAEATFWRTREASLTHHIQDWRLLSTTCLRVFSPIFRSYRHQSTFF